MPNTLSQLPREPVADGGSGDGPDLERLSHLIRSMLELTDAGAAVAAARGTTDTTEQVVFDLDVDGGRYVLIKTLPPERAGVSLSPREREIVRMVAQGHQNKVIAGVLSISTWTVCTHLRRIFAKLGVSSRAAMVAKMAECGGMFEPLAGCPAAPGPRTELRRRVAGEPPAPAAQPASTGGAASRTPSSLSIGASRAGSRIVAPSSRR